MTRLRTCILKCRVLRSPGGLVPRLYNGCQCVPDKKKYSNKKCDIKLTVFKFRNHMAKTVVQKIKSSVFSIAVTYTYEVRTEPSAENSYEVIFEEDKREEYMKSDAFFRVSKGSKVP
uniref:Cystatin domain-containing protein n=1 Tax=Rhabditophanes sp. KR3021 TaxID=114890 RepID=A0AC35TX42_9BILA